MEVDKFVKYIESHDYREWFSTEMICMLFRVVTKAKEEGLTIDELIEVLRSQVD